MASDRIGNPTDAQTATAISEPFVIVNALPVVTLSSPPKVGLDKSVVVQGIAAQSLIAITAVQVRIDGGEWMAASPLDGLFDGPREQFSYISRQLTSGKHTVEVEAFNSAAQKSLQKVEVVVP